MKSSFLSILMIGLFASQAQGRGFFNIDQTCDEAQYNHVVESVVNAQLFSNYASANLGRDSSEYAKWFGEYDRSRFLTVKETYRTIGSELRDGNVAVECSCDPDVVSESVIAYTYKNQHKFWVCDSFFNYPTFPGSRTANSKIGIVVHELSHAYRGAEDYVYGPSGSESLADSDPDKAIMNADNYQFFIENLLWNEVNN